MAEAFRRLCSAIHRRPHFVGLRGVAHKAIFMVQPAEDGCRDYFSVFAEAMRRTRIGSVRATDRESRAPGWRVHGV
jgi:hypothetical protein